MIPTILMTLGDTLDKTFFGFDMAIFKFFASLQNPFFDFVAKFFTSLGDEAFVIPMAVIGVVLCFFKKTRKYGFNLIFAIALGTIVTNLAVKPLALRIRPYNTLQITAPEFMTWYRKVGSLSESDYSFPSGHTTAAFEMATALFLSFKSDKKKIGYIFPIIALCVGGSRIYLMVHYPTDVIAGIIVGILAGVVGYFLMKLAMKLFTAKLVGKKGTEKKCLDDIIDVEKLVDKITGNSMKDKTKKIIFACVLTVAVVGVFAGSLNLVVKEAKENPLLCTYSDVNNGGYSCMNKAKLDKPEKYPQIPGREYCKIHWKEMNPKN